MKRMLSYAIDPEKIPFRKVVAICDSDGPTVNYSCPNHLFVEHLDAWRRARNKGNKTAPEPMPAGHCMFDTPEAYARVRYGDSSLASKRKAIESHVRGMLHGWDGFLYDAMPKEEAMEKFESIVKATVDDQMKKHETGAAPFLACVWAGVLA